MTIASISKSIRKHHEAQLDISLTSLNDTRHFNNTFELIQLFSEICFSFFWFMIPIHALHVELGELILYLLSCLELDVWS